MTLFEKLKLNIHERFLMWKTESLIWLSIAVIAAIAAYYTLQHIQFILYGLGVLLFWSAFAYAVHKLIENPVKDEIAIDKAKDTRKSLEEK